MNIITRLKIICIRCLINSFLGMDINVYSLKETY